MNCLLLTEKAVESVEYILALAIGLVLNESRSVLDHLAEFVTPLYASSKQSRHTTLLLAFHRFRVCGCGEMGDDGLTSLVKELERSLHAHFVLFRSKNKIISE